MLKVIQIQFFAFVLIVVTNFVKAQLEAGHLRYRNLLDSNVIHDLTDNDLKLAMTNLSLKDLKALETFIDSADPSDLDCQENSSTVEKGHSYDLDQQECDNSHDKPDQDEYNFGTKNIENDLDNYLKRQRDDYALAEEKQRAKRDDQMFNFNDGYTNQLFYSFPQNEQQNYNGIAMEKSHIRVKRNGVFSQFN